MATLADLKTRIVAETHRDDLEDELAAVLQQHIARAVEKFADERFWFNAVRATATATGGAPTLTFPADVRLPERVFVSGELGKIAFEELPEVQVQSVPLRWCLYGDSIWFDPIPSAAMAVTIIGVRHVDVPADDADDNIWTNEAADLIVAQVKSTLYRDVFRDIEAAAIATASAQEILADLKRDSRKRDKAPMRTDTALRPIYTTIIR